MHALKSQHSHSLLRVSLSGTEPYGSGGSGARNAQSALPALYGGPQLAPKVAQHTHKCHGCWPLWLMHSLLWLMHSPLYGQLDAGAIWNRTFNEFVTRQGPPATSGTSSSHAAEIEAVQA